MAIDVRKAVISAKNYFESLKDLISPKLEHLRLEEVELSEDEDFWLVTLGFDCPVHQPQDTLSEILPPLGSGYERVYRIFKIDSETAKVKSMKIRQL